MRTFSVCVPARRRVNVTFSYDVAENALRAFHLTFSGLLVFFTSDSDPCTCASPRFFFDRPSLSLSLFISPYSRVVCIRIGAASRIKASSCMNIYGNVLWELSFIKYSIWPSRADIRRVSYEFLEGIFTIRDGYYFSSLRRGGPSESLKRILTIEMWRW